MSQRFVSRVNLDPMKLIVNINHIREENSLKGSMPLEELWRPQGRSFLAPTKSYLLVTLLRAYTQYRPWL